MGSHCDRAFFGRSRWRKRILLPNWIMQIALVLSVMILFSYRLNITINDWKETGEFPRMDFVWECANITFPFVSLVVNLVQIAKFIAEVLTPLELMSGSILSLILSIAILALDIAEYVTHSDREYSAVGLALDSLLLVHTVGATIYGTIVYRRLFKYNDYHLTRNVQLYGFTNDQSNLDDTSKGDFDPTSPYDPSITDSHPRRPSFTFRRSTSGNSLESVSSLPRPSAERRLSYDHKRDTRFDEYRARRTSHGSGDLKADVEQALGAEFGWSGQHRDSVVNSGLVPSSNPRSRGNSLTRLPSWEGSLDIVPTDDHDRQIGHALVSVPEVHEEEDELKLPKRIRPLSEDRVLLLGGTIVASGSKPKGYVGPIPQIIEPDRL